MDNKDKPITIENYIDELKHLAAEGAEVPYEMVADASPMNLTPQGASQNLQKDAMKEILNLPPIHGEESTPTDILYVITDPSGKKVENVTTLVGVNNVEPSATADDIENVSMAKAAERVVDFVKATAEADTTFGEALEVADGAGMNVDTIPPTTLTVSKYNITVVEDSSYTAQDVMDILSNIEQVNESFEMNRNIAEADTKLQLMCNSIGIGRKDQEFIRKKCKDSNYTEDELNAIIANEKNLNKAFFTRDDGEIIRVKKFAPGYNDFKTKQELISFVYAFYVMEKEIEKELKDVNKETNTVMSAGVDVMTDHIANTFVRDTQAQIDKCRKEISEGSLNADTKEALNKATSLMKAWTFEHMIAVYESIPKVITNTLFDFTHPSAARRIGQQYGKNREATNTGSALYVTLQDDKGKSIEEQFLRPDQWVVGYENLFAFSVIRYYAGRSWKDKSSYVREQHNADCLILRALLEGRIHKEQRDDLIANIARVWEFFKKEIEKK